MRRLNSVWYSVSLYRNCSCMTLLILRSHKIICLKAQFVPHRKHCVSTAKNNRLVLFTEKMAVSESHNVHTHTVTCKCFARRIIMGSGLDDWIYWCCYYNYTWLQPLITVHNRWLPKTRSVSFLDYERLPLFLAANCSLVRSQFSLSYESSSQSLIRSHF
jgi:hypothetical protein